MRPVTATTVPAGSLLQPMLASANFHDAFQAPLNDPTLSPVEIYLRASRATPRWVNGLMDMRNAMVRHLGLKTPGRLSDVGDKQAASYKIADRIGIFSIFALTETELLMGIDDSHLDVRISVMKPGDGRYVLSSAVKIHNLLGRLYMLPVGRIHPFVVRAMMRRSAV